MNLFEAVTYRYSPYRITAILIWLAIAGFIVSIIGNYGAIITNWGLVPANLSLANPHSLVTLITSMFLHGDFLHIFFNMYFLWTFGQPIETETKSWYYLVLFVSGGIIAGLTHVLLNGDSSIPTIGASGAVSALMGWYAANYPRQQIYAAFLGLFPMRMTILAYMGIWFAIQLVGSLASSTSLGGGIAWWAHIGGFLWGLILGWIWRKGYLAP